MAKKKRELIEAKGDITPMIDCIFLLLIFFMVTTKFKKTEKKLAMNIPRSSSRKSASTQEPIIIELDESGNVTLNGGAVTLEGLAMELEKRLAAREEKDRRVSLDGRRTTYEKVMLVIDICNKRQVKDIIFKL